MQKRLEHHISKLLTAERTSSKQTNILSRLVILNNFEIDSLTEAGAGCLLIEGPADSHECAKVRSALKDEGPVAFVRRADLASIAALIASCRAYVGNDSGVTHLAAALGVCVVAVFGATDPLVWGPLGTCVAVVSARRRGRNGADDWPTEGDVFAALRDFGVFG